MAGNLFVVATPIGNLEDLTFRALRTLREVDLIAAEDTRRTAKLLAHYEIRRPVVSLREHNEYRETPRLIERLEAGENIALVSDAGTPTIADPGARLVRAAHERGIRVVPIPGPSAVVSALSVSGYSGDQFVFMGFPPSSGAARERWMTALAADERVVVFFESPHRIRRTLGDVDAACSGIRQIMACRELSKAHEELVITHKNAGGQVRETGEFSVVVGPGQGKASAGDIDAGSVTDLFGRLTNNAAIDSDEAILLVAAKFDVNQSVVRKIVKKAKILAKQQNRRSP